MSFKVIFQIIERDEKTSRVIRFKTKEIGPFDWDKAYLVRHKTALRKDVHQAVIAKSD